MRSRELTPDLIAPCGANCGICVAYFGYRMDGEKRKHSCPGCRSRQSLCAFIKKQCFKLAANQIEYCFECTVFPCDRLNALDNRHRSKYGMSLIENLKYIRDNGVEQFLKYERERWGCPNCGNVICVHKQICYACHEKTKNTKFNV